MVPDRLCGSFLHHRQHHYHHRHISSTKYDTYTSLLTVNLRSSSDSGDIHLTGRRPYSNKIFHWTDIDQPAHILVISIHLLSLFVVVPCWVFIRFTSYYLYKLPILTLKLMTYNINHHHFHYASQSLHLCSTPDSKLTFSINPSHHSPLAFSDVSHEFLWPFPDLTAHRIFFCFALFILFDLCDRLSWFYQLLNCT